MLLRLVVKNLWQRPLRNALTGMAVALGVATVTAVFIFTDGLRTTFDELAQDIQSGFDVAVQSPSPFGKNVGIAEVRLGVVDDIQDVEGIDSIQPRILDFGVVAIDGDGTAVTSLSGPNIGLNWPNNTSDPQLFLVEGQEPTTLNDFALDTDTFNSNNFTLGENYQVTTPSGTKEFTLVGTFNYADPEANGTVGGKVVAFEQQAALELLNGGRGYDDITIVAEGSPDELISRLQPILNTRDENLKAIPQSELVANQQADFQEILIIFQTVLLVFAVIILFVSSFLIYNVFTITLGQRITELGALRALGAMGGQITRMMLNEALILGLLATAVGIPSGWLIARGLRQALKQFGFPGNTGLPLNPSTILYAVAVGVVVTVLAAIWPSIRAQRISPMAALRDDITSDDLESISYKFFGVMVILIAGGVTSAGYWVDGWVPRIILPTVGATLLYLGFRSLGSWGRKAASFVLVLFGLGVLVVVQFSNFVLEETFGLIGAGSGLTVLGASQASSATVRPFARIAGRFPGAIAASILGLAIAAAAMGSIVATVLLLKAGITSATFIPFGTVVLSVVAYGLLRTAWGAFGLTGHLARENAARKPQRTAATATALMIGLALVTAVTVIGDSIKSSITEGFESSITADWFVQGQTGADGSRTPFSAEAANQIEQLDSVGQVVEYQTSSNAFVTIQGDLDLGEIEPLVPQLLAALKQGDSNKLAEIQQQLGATRLASDPATITDLRSSKSHIDPKFASQNDTLLGQANSDQAGGGTGIYLENDVATERGLALGDQIVAVFSDGRTEVLTVAGVYKDVSIFGEQVIDFELWNRHTPESETDVDSFITVLSAEGVPPEAARESISSALANDYPNLLVQDRTEVAADAAARINQTLATINVLLALSVAIAILGIGIALSLAVFERTREIGLLRAVGADRRHIRWMVRWEGVIIAAFGGIVGTTVGVGLGALAAYQLPEFLVTSISIPFRQLALYIVVATLTGLGSGTIPAWVAGRLAVLTAIGSN